jgi:hypothetical protein
VGLLSRLRLVGRAARGESFTAPEDLRPIDQVIVAQGRTGWGSTISRETALQVPAVLRGRNLICSISTLPLVQYDPAGAQARNPLFVQTDPQVANVVTWAQLVEDLMFEGTGWLRVLSRSWNGFPSSAQHVDVSRVHLNARRAESELAAVRR